MRAFDRAKDATELAKSKVSGRDIDVLFSAEDLRMHSRFTLAELPAWLLFVTHLFIMIFLLAHIAVVPTEQLILAVSIVIVSVVLSGWLISNLVMAMMRRQQMSTSQHVRSFRMRGYFAIGCQAVLFAYGLSRSIGTPWLLSPIAYNHSINPCEFVGDGYRERYCQVGQSLTGPLILCNDGGYESYNSTLAACEAARSQPSFLADMACALMISLNLFLFLIFRQLWRINDDELTARSTSLRRLRRSKISQRRLDFVAKGSMLLALSCSPVFLGVMLARASSEMQTVASTDELRLFIGRGTVAYINLALWCVSLLSFNIASIREWLMSQLTYVRETTTQSSQGAAGMLVHVQGGKFHTSVDDALLESLWAAAAAKHVEQADLYPHAVRRKEVMKQAMIGHGHSALVHHGTLGRYDIALKRLAVSVRVLKPKIEEAAKHELELLRRAQHPNVIKGYGVILDAKKSVYIVMELAPEGLTLRSYLNKASPSAFDQHHLALGIVLGMDHLHGLTSPILHRDLKSDNVLLVQEEPRGHGSGCLYRPKIADFSSATDAATDRVPAQQQPGTKQYMAPEAFRGQYTKASDVYSFAIILWELLFQSTPWEGVSDIRQQVCRGERPPVNEQAANAPGLSRIMKRCWEGEPDQRPTFDDMLSGRLAHHLIPPEYWCITHDDLKEFEEQVRKAQRNGCIPQHPDHPNANHEDPTIGPTMHAVVAHVVKTSMTEAGVSWALQRHRGGKPIDIFCTHCWNEGVYEFCTKMRASWPAGLETMWFCCLANPQTWERNELAALLGGGPGSVSDPLRDSPFARALSSAKVMLVVPNTAESIYTRLWCVAEIKVAKDFGKSIRVATEHGSTQNLLTNFSSVRQAKCSDADDEARIRKAIEGQENEIDKLIHDLVSKGGTDLKEVLTTRRV